MDRVCFEIGAWRVHWYGVCMAAAFLAALGHWTLLGRRHNRSGQFASDLAFWLMVAGLLGARIAYVASEWRFFLENPAEIPRLDHGGAIFYGGFFGAFAALVIIARLRRESLLGLMDFTASAIPLAHAIGRIGCFLNGCCYGTPAGRLPGVVYPAWSDAWKHQLEQGIVPWGSECTLPVHAVQLYEAFWLVLVYAVLVWVYDRPGRRDGMVVGLYFLLYGFGRLCLEHFRGDPRMGVAWGMDVAQSVSLGIMIVGLALIAWSRRRRAADGAIIEDTGRRGSGGQGA